MSVDPNISATPLPGGPERTAHDAVAVRETRELLRAAPGRTAREQRLAPPYLVHVMGERTDHVFKTAHVLAVDQIIIATPAGLGCG